MNPSPWQQGSGTHRQPSALAILGCLNCSGSSTQRNCSVWWSFCLNLGWIWKATNSSASLHSNFTCSLFFATSTHHPSQVLGHRHYQINYLHINSSQKIHHGTLSNFFRAQEKSWGFKLNDDSTPTPCCSTVQSPTVMDTQFLTPRLLPLSVHSLLAKPYFSLKRWFKWRLFPNTHRSSHQQERCASLCLWTVDIKSGAHFWLSFSFSKVFRREPKWRDSK